LNVSRVVEFTYSISTVRIVWYYCIVETLRLNRLSECECEEAESQAESKFLRAARFVGDGKSVDVDWKRSSRVAVQDFVPARSSVSGIVPESSVFFILSSSFTVRLRQILSRNCVFASRRGKVQ
jgi:hypothetical protein